LISATGERKAPHPDVFAADEKGPSRVCKKRLDGRGGNRSHRID